MEDGWNDFSYRTTCDVFVYTAFGASRSRLGYIKIMYRGQKIGPWVFEDRESGPISPLGRRYCSLAIDPNFYIELNKIGARNARAFLKAVRDAAFMPDVWKSFEPDDCFKTSILRSVAAATETRDLVAKLFMNTRPRVINRFRYRVTLPGAVNPHELFFDFRASPPISRREILLVGPNGAGKTQVLANLAIALTGIVEKAGDGDEGGEARLKFQQAWGLVSPSPSFYGVIAISFNAFDEFQIPESGEPLVSERGQLTRYTYCGIRAENGAIRENRELKSRIGEQVKSLDADKRQILKESVREVIGERVSRDLLEFDLLDCYDHLSAGQKIALNILTHLVSNLRDQSLVLIDEPETHLHPGLMTRLLSEISKLLDKFNSFAIVATHSPLLAQQTLSKSIRIFSRSDNNVVEISVPDFECFGENISALTNRLFNPGEARRDYAELLRELLQKYNNNPDEVEKLFPDGLGTNARTYLWSIAQGHPDEDA